MAEEVTDYQRRRIESLQEKEKFPILFSRVGMGTWSHDPSSICNLLDQNDPQKDLIPI